MVIKTRRCNKATFLYNTLKKTLLRESLSLALIQFFGGEGWWEGEGAEVGVGAYLCLRGLGGGGRLIDVGANSRLSAYSNKYGESLGSTDSNNQENNIWG